MTRYDIIAEIGCVICSRPPQMHHLKGYPFTRGMSRKAKNEHVIGLCLDHHTGQNGYHHSPHDFTEKYGTQSELLERQNQLISDYCSKWGIAEPQ